MGWFMPTKIRGKKGDQRNLSRTSLSRVQPVVEKLEDRTAPAVALFSGGTLFIDPTGSDQATLLDGASPGTQLRVLMSSGTLDISSPSIAALLAPGSTPTDATFNLDVIGNDVNKLRVDFGVTGQNVVTFSGLTPTSLLDVDVTDQPGVNSNLMILAGKVNLSAANGNFNALTSRLSMSVFGALDSGTGAVTLASTLAGGSLNVSSGASPQIKGGQVYLDFQGAIGDAANPLKVQASTSLEAYTNNATASLQAVGSVNLLGLDMGTGIGSLFGTFTTSGASKIGDNTTVELNAGAKLTLGGNETIRALKGSGSLVNGGFQLTLGTTTTETFSGDISGTGILAVSGTGNQILSGASTYSGGTSVASGTLTLANGTGAGTGTITISSGATLLLIGDMTVANKISVAGTGTNGFGAIQVTSGFITLSGGITQTGSTLYATDFTVDLVVSGTIANGGSANNLSHIGTGRLHLNAANTYGGTTNVDGGIVILGNNTAASTGPVVVANGGVLDLDGGITVANQIYLEGSGLTGDGALRSTGGDNTASGSILLNGDAMIGVENGRTLTISGVISDFGTGRGVTFKNGAVILTKDNTYTGTTQAITAAVQLGNGAASGSVASASFVNEGLLSFKRSDSGFVFTPVLSGSGAIEVLTGGVEMDNDNPATGAVTIATGASLQLGNGGATGSLASSTITDDGKLIYNRSGNVTPVAAVGGSGTVTYRGTATYTLATANSYTGGTVVSDSAVALVSDSLALGGGTATVNAGAALALSSNSSLSLSNDLNLVGSGPLGEGALQNRLGDNSVTGTVSLTGATVVSTGENTSLGVYGVISGAFGLTHTVYGAGAAGTMSLVAANTFSGGLVIQAGLVALLNNTAAGTGAITVNSGSTLALNGSFGDLTVANNIGVSGQGVNGIGAILNSFGKNTLTGSITLGASSTFAVNDQLTTTGAIGDGGKGYALTLSGSNTLITTAANTYTGNTVIGSGATLQLGNGTATGSLKSAAVFDDGALVFNRTDAVGTPFVFGPVITGTGTVQVKTGAVQLATDSDYTGATTVDSGATLILGNNSPTGSIGSTAITVNGALIFNRNDLSTNPFVEGATFSGSGSMTVKTGAVALTADSPGYTGSVTINPGTYLQLGNGGSSGSLGATTITDNGTLAFYRTGDQTIATQISGSGLVEFIGGGDYTLSGANSYSGGTFIGAISPTRVNLANSSGAGTGVITVFDQSTLGLVGTGMNVANSLLMSGSGVGGIGALYNNFGDNTYSGSIVLNAGSIISAAPGTELLLTSPVGDGGNTYGLTVGGAGTVITSAANTYKGTTNILFGATFQLGNGGTTGAVASTAIVADGTLAFNRTDSTTITALISGTGSLDVNSGSVTLTANNTFSGAGFIAPGATLTVGNGTNSGNLPAATILDQGTLIYARNNLLSITPVISGTGEVHYTKGANYLVSGANSYSGGTVVDNNSVVVLSNSTGLGSGDAVFSNGSALALDGTLGDLSVPNALFMTGSGLGGAGAIQNIFGKNTITGLVTLTGTTYIFRDGSTSLDLAGGVAETGGPNQLWLQGLGELILSAAGSYTGGTGVDAGRLTLSNNTGAGSGIVAIGAGADLNLDGSAGDLTVANDLILAGSGPSGKGTVVNAVGNNTLTGTLILLTNVDFVTAAGTKLNLAGTITDSGNILGLTARGDGTLQLSGTGNYSGANNVFGGNLLLTSSTGAGSGLISVLTGATLQISGGLTVSNAIRLSGDGPGGAGALQVLDGDNIIQGAITLTDNSTIALSGTSTLLVSGVIDDGALDKSLTVSGPNGSYLTLTAANTFTGSTTIDGTGVILGDGKSASGSLASKSIIFMNNGGLAVDRTDGFGTPFTIAAVMSGDGEFAVYQGAVLLTSPNTYTGGTQVQSAGALLIGPGSSLSSTPIMVDGVLQYQQAGTVNLNAVYMGTGEIGFTGGGTYNLLTTSLFIGQATVDVGTTLSVQAEFPGDIVFAGNLSGNNLVGAITGTSGANLIPGVNGSGFLQAWDLDFLAAGGTVTYTVSDTGTSLVNTGLILDGGLDADLSNAKLVVNPSGTLVNQGTVLYLVDFTNGGSVGASRFTDSIGNVIPEGGTVTFGGKTGTLHYNFGPEGNDVVLLMVDNYSSYTYDAAAGTLLIELGQNTNLTASDLGATTSFVISPAAADPIAWVQFGGDPAGGTPTNLVINPALSSNLTIRQRSSVISGTNLVALDGLKVGGDLTVQLNAGSANGISIGGTGLTVAGKMFLATNQGSITQSGAVSVTGATTLGAATDILLADPTNQFGGLVTASATNQLQIHAAGNLQTGSIQSTHVDLNAAGNLKVGVVTSLNLNLISGGSISQTGPITSTGTTVIDAAGTVNLDDKSNDFSKVSITGASDTVLVDASSLTLTQADNLAGKFSVTTQGNLNLNLPQGKLLAASDIALTTPAGNSVVSQGTFGLTLISNAGGIQVNALNVQANGPVMAITAATGVRVPELVLANTGGLANVLVSGQTISLGGDVDANGGTGASIGLTAPAITLEGPTNLTAQDLSGKANETITVNGDIQSATAASLMLTAGSQVQVNGSLGISGSQLGSITLEGGDVKVTGEILSTQDVNLAPTNGTIHLVGNVMAINVRINDNAGFRADSNIYLTGDLTLDDATFLGDNIFGGSVDGANILVTSSVSLLQFQGLVNLTGKVSLDGIGPRGVSFADNLVADQLLANASSDIYQVELLSSATITQPVSFQNGAQVVLGNDAGDLFQFKGGLNQGTGASAVYAVGTIRTNGGAVTIDGLVVNGLPLSIDTTGGGSGGAAINILGPADVASGLSLKGTSNTFSGTSTLTTGKVTGSQGGITLGSGNHTFQVDSLAPGSGYTQFVTGGQVTLTNADLTLNMGSYVAGVGSVIVLVDNTGSSAVSGTFNGLPEGATYTVGGQTFVISYTGGTGNDITARAVRTIPTPTGPVVALPFSLDAGSLVVGIGRGQVLIRSANGGDQVITPFPFFTGSVNLTTVDRSGDGVADAVVAMVAGGAEPAVVVIDSTTGRVAQSFYAFAPQFSGGGTVAGGVVNLNGTVTTVIAVGAGAGAEPSVTVFDAITGTFIEAFYAYAQQYTGGVTVGITAPDVNQNSLIIAASAINSHVTLFDLNTPLQAVASFYAFSPSPVWQPISVAGGVFTGADNKPFQAIIVGAAPGWPSSVAVFDIRGVAQKAFYAFNPAFTGGVRVGVSDLNKDGRLEVLAGSGPGALGTLNVFDYNTLALVDALFVSDTLQGVTIGSNLTV